MTNPFSQVATGDTITAAQHNEVDAFFESFTAHGIINSCHKGASIASAGTLSLGADGNYFHVTGSTGPITAISNPAPSSGTVVVLCFDSTPTLTHSSSLFLMGATNYTAAANDMLVFIYDGSSVWKQIGSLPASGGYVTLTGTQSLTNKSLVDASTSVVDDGDATKKLVFSLGGATTAKTATIVSSHTNDRTITLFDASDTVVGKNTTDTLTNKTLTTPTISSTGFTNAQHPHSGATSGGQIAYADITGTPAASAGTLYNWLVNPGVTQWQRGTGAFTANNAYTADRWQNVLSGSDTNSTSRESTNKPTNAIYSGVSTFVQGSGTASGIRQVLKITTDELSHYALLGQTISFSMAIRTATASAVKVYIKTDGTGGTTTLSSFHTGGATFEILSAINVTVPTDATSIEIGWQGKATSTIYWGNAMLAITATAPTFAGLTPAEDWDRVLRYYEQGQPQYYAYGSVGMFFEVPVSWNTRKSKNPTTTVVTGGYTFTNCGTPTAVSGKTLYQFDVVVTALGAFNAQPGVATDGVFGEANP